MQARLHLNYSRHVNSGPTIKALCLLHWLSAVTGRLSEIIYSSRSGSVLELKYTHEVKMARKIQRKYGSLSQNP